MKEKTKEVLLKCLEAAKVILLALIAALSASCSSMYSVSVKQSQPEQEQSTIIETTTTITGANLIK